MRDYTSKQMGDACEMLVAGELTLHGVPAMIVPDGWPSYDVIAQPRDGRSPQRISVKSRTFKRGGDNFVEYRTTDEFEWLAIVLLPSADQPNRRIFVIPRCAADERARQNKPASKVANLRYWRQDEVPKFFSSFENNFRLSQTGNAGAEVVEPVSDTPVDIGRPIRKTPDAGAEDVFDLIAGLAPGSRSKSEIDQQIHEERASWGDQ